MTDNHDELEEFLLVVRRALLLVVRWIEKKYNIAPSSNNNRSDAI